MRVARVSAKVRVASVDLGRPMARLDARSNPNKADVTGVICMMPTGRPHACPPVFGVPDPLTVVFDHNRLILKRILATETTELSQMPTAPALHRREIGAA